MRGNFSKIYNSKLLLKNHRLAKHVPETRILSYQSLNQMLKRYPMVYVKPDNGCMGRGIIQIRKDGEEGFIARSNTHLNNDVICSCYRELWNKMNGLRMKRTYIVQQGINSFTRANHLFDIRVHLIKMNHKWRVVGMVARIAPKDHIVTNTYDAIYKPVHILLFELGYRKIEIKNKINEFIWISKQASTEMNKVKPGWKEYGLDIGISRDGKVWIYEINSCPSPLIFKELNEKVYQRIMYLSKKVWSLRFY